MRPRLLALLYITQAAGAVAIGPSTARLSPAAATCSLVPQLDALGGTAKANDWRVADLTRAEIGGAEQRPSELRYLTRDVPKKERVEVTFGAAAARVLCALAPAPELAVAALDWQGGGKSVKTEAAARAVAAGVLCLDTGA